MASWRKDKQTEEWKVFALVDEVLEDGSVMVTTKAGAQQKVFIESWAKPFQTEDGLAAFGKPVSRGR